MYSTMLACVLWLPILALALPQSPKPKPQTIDLQLLSSILFFGETPPPVPTPIASSAATSSERVVWITVTPPGPTIKSIKIVTSINVVPTTPPPTSTTTTWITVDVPGPSKRGEQLSEVEGENRPFVPTITGLPELALGPEEEQDKKNNDTSSLPKAMV
jgi:hypothetical protein